MIIISTQAFPPDSGGKQTLIAGLARAAAQQSTVLVLADKARESVVNDASSKPRYDIKRFGGIKSLRQRKKAKAVKNYATSLNATHIFCDSWRSAEHLPADLPCPVSVYAHGNEYPRKGDRDYNAKLHRIRTALSNANILMAVSQNTKERAAPFTPSHCRAQVVHNPIDVPEIASLDDEAFAESLWPDTEKKRCLVLCRLIDWKGVDMAIRAAARRHDCQLVIAGIGDDLARLNTLVEELKASDRIAFVGRIEGAKKSALYASADVFLQPGRRVGDQCEGYGITYVEAALHGLPSICGDQGGAPEAVIDGQTAFVVDATELENVSIALAEMLDNTDMRKDMSRKAKAHANNLLWPKQIERILTLAGQ